MITNGLVVDAGGFIAIERGDGTMRLLVDRIRRENAPLATSAGIVAQVWRGGSRKQTEVAFLLRRCRIVDLTEHEARTVGILLGTTRTHDPVDAHVALIARRLHWPVLTSDPDDLRSIDPKLTIYPI